MNSKDFRIGNLVYYNIEDSMDERKAWDEVSPIDYDDLRCFEQYEDNSEYKLIPLTKEWLLKLPNSLKYPNWIKYVHELQNWYYWNNNKKEGNLVKKCSTYREAANYLGCHLVSISRAITKRRKTLKKYILTNFALTGEELTIK